MQMEENVQVTVVSIDNESSPKKFGKSMLCQYYNDSRIK